MKKITSFIILCFILSSCNKNPTQTNTTSKNTTNTSLQIKVLDTLGNMVTNAKVYLYAAVNYLADTATTNENGLVTFANVFPQKYYYTVYYGCENNIFNSDSTNILISDSVNFDSTTVQSTGFFYVANGGTGFYNIFLDGALIVDSLNSLQPYKLYVKTGIHAIKVFQVAPYSGIQKDTTYYTPYILCGETDTLNFN